MKIPFLSLLAAMTAPVFGYEVKVRVTDEAGAPLAGAKAEIAFASAIKGDDACFSALTPENGEFSAKGTAQHSVIVSAEKPGYYPARWEQLPRDRDLDLAIVLPKIRQPISLYAQNFRTDAGGPALEFPAQNEWLGYDFEVGDWIAPYGKGQLADIRFKFTRDFAGWRYTETEVAELRQRPTNRNKGEDELRLELGHWRGTLEISFPGKLEGLIAETRNFLPYSRLKMPHCAPADGYETTKRYTAATDQPVSGWDKMVGGYFLRTRVRRDELGRMESANYAKIFGDFHFDARGFVRFSYCFNPIPNDRNLEFDPKRNLFPRSVVGADARDP